jgi:hypothetical protein
MCEFRVLLSQNIELQPAGHNVAVPMWSQLEQMSALRHGLKAKNPWHMASKTPMMIAALFFLVSRVFYGPMLLADCILKQ